MIDIRTLISTIRTPNALIIRTNINRRFKGSFRVFRLKLPVDAVNKIVRHSK